MADKHGDWVWYELMTSDAVAAQAFYAPLLGWKIANPAQDGFDYREIQAADDGYIGGIMQITPEMHGARPAWMGYIAVDDVDAAVASIQKAGGRLYGPAREMEGVGRFATVTDPQGAVFNVFKSATNDESTAFARTAPNPGHCAWNELATSDAAGALSFYSSQFGWTKDGGMEMGPLGTYHFIKSDVPLGAIFTRPPEMPVSLWAFYFRVTDIDSATEQVKANGGQVVNGPQAVPGGDWVINGVDPQGAFFALVGQRAA